MAVVYEGLVSRHLNRRFSRPVARPLTHTVVVLRLLYTRRSLREPAQPGRGSHAISSLKGGCPWR